MKEHGVVGVVNMCVEWPGPQDAYAEAGIKQIRLPTVDTTAPSYTDLAAGIAFIKETLATSPDGSRIFIHCKAGRVRHAFFLGCFSLSFSITLSFLKFSFFSLLFRASVRACVRASVCLCVRACAACLGPSKLICVSISGTYTYVNTQGRAGTMAIAWYVAQGNSREEALRIVRAKRKVVSTVRAIDDSSTSCFVNRDERTLTGCTDPARIDGGR